MLSGSGRIHAGRRVVRRRDEHGGSVPGIEWTNVRVGVEALRIHPLRTLLSVLGITIGSAALMATLSVSDGLMAFARRRVARETSVQVVSILPRTHVRKRDAWVPVHAPMRFTSADAAELAAETPGVIASTLVLSGPAQVESNGRHRAATLLLGGASLPDFGVLEPGAGRFFADGEVRAHAPVVVANYALARELEPTRDPYGLVGHDVRVNGRRLRVVGVLTPTGYEDWSAPACALYAPFTAAKALLPVPRGGRFAPAVQLLAGAVEDVDDVRERVEGWLAQRDPRWHERAQVHVGLQELRSVERAFRVVEAFVGALVGISLVVGGIGIMNVLLASVTERTREIGIRKSVGARGADIRTQFLAESVAIALAGSSVGLVLGLLAALLVSLVLRQAAGAPVWPAVSPASVLLTLGSSSCVGLAFGTYPARRAARLSPVAAMAHE